MATQVTLNSGSVDSAGSLALKTNGTTTAVTINASQGVEFNAGAVGTPSITTTGDTNTGIFFPAADQVAITTGGTQRAVVDASGNVGIGTSSPASKLDIGGAGSLITLHRASDGNGTGKIGSRSGSDFSLYNDGGSTSEVIVTGSTVNFNTVGAERMRIDSSGNLLMGTTSVIQAGAICNKYDGQTRNGIMLQTTFASAGTGFIRFLNSSETKQGEISANTTTTVAYGTSSDYRLKNTIAPMTGALAKVSLLKPCTYKWNADGSDGQGFIAHELQEVCPDAVIGEKDAVNEDGSIDPQGIDTSFLVATLTAALQEAHGLIKDLQVRVNALEAK
jgi:hypothetical protein